MLFYYLNMVLSGYSIIFAFLIGVIRFKQILKGYRPFIYLTGVALGNEIISSFVSKVNGSNAINSNIYVLVEGLLLLWLFKNWKIGRKRNFFKRMALFTFLVWIADTLFLHHIDQFSSVYRIFYSYLIIYLSINEINRIIINERTNILRDSRFILCAAFVIFFSYKAILETFYLFELQFSTAFYRSLFLILTLLNLFTNLVYALAVLWMPTKQKFSLPYS